MFKNLAKNDFSVFKGPFESGRQSPNLLSVSLFGIVLFQSLCLYIEFDLAETSRFPNINKILDIHIGASIALLICCLIYSIPYVYIRSQKIQYIITIIATQNLFAISFLLMALFTLGQSEDVSIESMQRFSNVILIIGILIFAATSIRIYTLLIKGEYRKGSDIDELRANLELKIKRNLPSIMIASVGLVFIIQFLIRNIDYIDLEMIFLTTVPVLIFFTMLFVLPEQLIILYCKFRFKSFNYDMNGYLLSEDLDSEGKVRNGN